MTARTCAYQAVGLAAAASVILAVVAPPAAAAPARDGGAAVAPAVPPVLAGDTWLNHHRNDLMPYWDMQDALGDPVGNFPTFRDRAGHLMPDSPTRGLVALSRCVYGYSLAFMMTGQPRYLTYARAGLDWIETHAADPAYGGYFGELNADGSPVDAFADKDVSGLAAVGLAYGMYFNATRDPDAEAHLLAVRDLLMNKYYDAATNRIRDALTYDLTTEIDDGNNGGDLGNYVSVITNDFLFEAPLLSDPARRAQFRGDIRTLVQSMINNFQSTAPASNWWFWGRTKRIGNFNALDTTFGHNLKAYGIITNANRMLADHPWDSQSARRSTLIARAWDDGASRWNQQLVSFAPGAVVPDSVWWMHDEGDELLASLDLDNGFAYSGQLARSVQTFLDIYVDHDPAYPGETFTRVQRTGVIDVRKSWFGKAMLHNYEHALVLYLHGRAMEGRPATLYYAFPAGQALTAVAKPYWFDAAREFRSVGGELPNLPGHRIVAVAFSGLDAVAPQPYPAPADTTPPSTTASVSPAPNANGWNRSDATVALNASDDMVGTRAIHAAVVNRDGTTPDVAYIEPGANFTLPPLTDEGVYDVTYFGVDLLGNAEQPHTLQVRIDTTAPTVTVTEPPAGAHYLLDQPVSASFACDDVGGSALASCVGSTPDGAPIDTSTVGPHTFTVTAADRADNTASVSRSYDVGYAFSGLFSPIDPLPTVNVANAGRTIPVKWRIVDADGVGVAHQSSFGSVTSASTACDGSGASDAIEAYAVGSGLQYLGDGYWQFDWKTPKSFAGQCRTMSLNLADTVGADRATLQQLGRTALMQFK
jgi:mannose/cellobiose epimerase-like protein (N-acyl-D-glucosamine 2-epimerase family)